MSILHSALWAEYRDIDLDSGDFPEVGRAFEKACDINISPVGQAVARLMPQQQLVDFAGRWFTANRSE